MKKTIISIAALLICLSMLPLTAIAASPVTASNPAGVLPFTDVSENDWYYQAVRYAYEAGLLGGTSDTAFSPNNDLTYAEAVKLAACMHQKYTTGAVSLANGTPWYQTYVEYARSNRIISRDYNWNNAATREGYMEIFANALPNEALTPINEVEDGAIPDVPMSRASAGAVYKLYRAGITQGVDAAHNCSPGSNIKRGEVAVIIMRMMDPSTRISFTLQAGASTTIPGGGGEFSVNGPTMFSFTPNQTCVWLIRSSNNGNSDPYIAVLDSDGESVAEDDDNAGNMNALVHVMLRAGTQYTVDARFYGGGTGNYTLTVSPAPVLAASGSTQVNGATGFSFTPSQTGVYQFRTSNNGNNDPFLAILTDESEFIAADDDGGGDLNSLLIVPLAAGRTYILHAGCISNNPGNFTLTVSTLTATPIPASGGDITVRNVTAYTFSPDQSGVWQLLTSNNSNCDPMLAVYDSEGARVAIDDDTGGDLNALIITSLNAGTTYYVIASYYGEATSSYSLSVAPANILPTSGSVTVNGRTGYAFTPDRTGVWQFRTSNNGDSDPFLAIMDMDGMLIGLDDDGGGSLNASLLVPLKAGETYILYAMFYDSYDRGSFTLTVSSVTPTQIPASGGNVNVSGTSAYSFTPGQSGVWQFLTSNNGNSDPTLTLYDADGEMVAYDDDGAGDLNSLLVSYLNAGTTYYIIAGYYSDPGPYTLSASRAPALPTSGSVNVNGSTVYAFTPDRSGIWQFHTSDCGEFDPYLMIYSADGSYIGSDDDGGEGLNSLLLAPLKAGETYLVYAEFYFYGEQGSYTLTVSPATPVAIAPGGGSVTVNGTTVYSFTPDRNGTWEFRTSNNGNSDPVLVLYDADGAMIAFDDDGGGDLNSLIVASLRAGTTYYVFARFFGDGSGSYTLSVTAR